MSQGIGFVRTTVGDCTERIQQLLASTTGPRQELHHNGSATADPHGCHNIEGEHHPVDARLQKIEQHSDHHIHRVQLEGLRHDVNQSSQAAQANRISDREEGRK